jgi:2-oxoglutarate ferredoxin oxidoreductase subunit delta
MTTGIVSRGTLVIDIEACKGCELCIDACPPGVLTMTSHEVNHRGYRYPELWAGCTGCKACSQICPDFVFQVYKYDTPVRTEVSGTAGSNADESNADENADRKTGQGAVES